MNRSRDLRPVSDTYKLQAQSLPEIKQLWKQVSLDLSESVRDVLDGGALRDGNLLNAFVIWCCLQPPERTVEDREVRAEGPRNVKKSLTRRWTCGKSHWRISVR